MWARPLAAFRLFTAAGPFQLFFSNSLAVRLNGKFVNYAECVAGMVYGNLHNLLLFEIAFNHARDDQ